nr:titin-like [Lytechinus pictus]
MMPKAIDVRKRLSEPTFDYQTNLYADDNGNNSSDEVYIEVFSEDKASNSWTDEKKTKYGELLKKYNDIKEENLILKDEKKRLHDRVQCLEEIVDEGEEYSMIVDRSEIPAKPDNYAKIKATKHVQTELEVSNQEKGAVPVSRAASNSSPQPVKVKKPPVPIRTDSRNYIQSANLPVPSPRVSLDDTAKPARVDSDTIVSDSQGSKDENATPTITPKPPARVPKLPSQPPSDPISPALDAKPNLDVGHLPPMGLPFAVHSGLTKEEVVSFLEARKLGKYSESFIQNDIDGELLLALDEEIMIDELGLTKLDARKLSLVLKKHKSSDSVFLES